MKKNLINAIAKFFLFIAFYVVSYIILETINKIFNRKMSTRAYLLPLIAIFIISFFTNFAFKISEEAYSFMYYAASFFIGMEIHYFWIILIYRFLSLFFTFNQKLSIVICIISPLIISVYACYKSRVVYRTDINIKLKKKIDKKIKICQLSDLHLGVLYQEDFTEHIINIVKKEINPDVIAITGDLFDNSFKPNISWLKPFETISKDIPILYVTGNHESLIGKRGVNEVIKKTNFICLGDSTNCITINECFDFYGVNYEPLTHDFIKKIKKFELDNEKANILLGHCPMLSPNELGSLKIDIFLAGHTHGGQMFPIHFIDYGLNKCFSGLYGKDGKWVYVSPGLGTVIFPMRLGSYSTISVITVEGEEC